MLQWDFSVKWQVEELLQEAKQAQLVRQVPRNPSRLGAWLRGLFRRLTVARITIDDPLAQEQMWPQLTDYPYSARRTR
jgi:hypothetical protein